MQRHGIYHACAEACPALPPAPTHMRGSGTIAPATHQAPRATSQLQLTSPPPRQAPKVPTVALLIKGRAQLCPAGVLLVLLQRLLLLLVLLL